MRYSPRALPYGELNQREKPQPYAPDNGEVSENVVEDWMRQGRRRIVHVIEQRSGLQVGEEGSAFIDQRIRNEKNTYQDQKESERCGPQVPAERARVAFTQSPEDRLNNYFLLIAATITASPMTINNAAQKNLATPLTIDQRFQNGQNQGAT